MNTQKQSITLDLDIFIHLMTSAYREGLKAGLEHEGEDRSLTLSSINQFRCGMTDMLKEHESGIQH